MNLGRSEYTRLLKKEIRLKKAEILLEECFKEIKSSVENTIDDGMMWEENIEQVMADHSTYYGGLLNELKSFIESKEEICWLVQCRFIGRITQMGIR